MFRVNDFVVYGTHGLYRISAIERHSFVGKELDYYVLHHISDQTDSAYIPLRNKQAVSKLHPICTKEEITDLILHMNDVKPKRITNVVERKEEYDRILKSANRSEIIMHLNHLYLLRRKLSKEQRKLPPTDADFLETAERILFEEFSFVLGIEKTEIIEYIQTYVI